MDRFSRLKNHNSRHKTRDTRLKNQYTQSEYHNIISSASVPVPRYRQSKDHQSSFKA